MFNSLVWGLESQMYWAEVKPWSCVFCFLFVFAFVVIRHYISDNIQGSLKCGAWGFLSQRSRTELLKHAIFSPTLSSPLKAGSSPPSTYVSADIPISVLGSFSLGRSGMGCHVNFSGVGGEVGWIWGPLSPRVRGQGLSPLLHSCAPCLSGSGPCAGAPSTQWHTVSPVHLCSLCLKFLWLFSP